MPYVPEKDRPVLDESVNALAEEIVEKLGPSGSVELSTLYKERLVDIGTILYRIETGSYYPPTTCVRKVASDIFDVAKKYNYKGAWLGELNYSVTRLIQVVPKKMVENGNWKEEFRYWLYAQTAGALERSASEIDNIGVHTKEQQDLPWKHEWIFDGIVGVFHDVKDEYKRRVNTAYEAVQILKSGDCYDTPYHTELVPVKDEKGNVIGYQEVMKDFRKKVA